MFKKKLTMDKPTLEQFRVKVCEAGIAIKSVKRINKPWDDWALELLDELVQYRGAKAITRKVYHDYISNKAKKSKKLSN